MAGGRLSGLLGFEISIPRCQRHCVERMFLGHRAFAIAGHSNRTIAESTAIRDATDFACSDLPADTALLILHRPLQFSRPAFFYRFIFLGTAFRLIPGRWDIDFSSSQHEDEFGQPQRRRRLQLGAAYFGFKRTGFDFF